MMAILDKEKLTGQQQKNKLEVITILGKFLKNTGSNGLSVPTWDRELDDNGFSWLGWTVVNGTAEDVAALIKSKQPFDPLLGKHAVRNFNLNLVKCVNKNNTPISDPKNAFEKYENGGKLDTLFS